MKKIVRIRSFCLLCCVCLVITMFSSVYAADGIDGLASQILEAVENGDSSVKLTVGSTDLKGTFRQLFLKYPALFIYYNGYSGNVYGSHATVTVQLRNQSVPWEKIYVADSLEEVRSMVGYSLSRLEPGFWFVMTQGPMVSSEHIAQFAEELKLSHYFAFMGYHGNQLAYTTNEDFPVVAYEVSYRYWEGVSVATLAQWRQAAEHRALELASTLFAQDMPDYQKELLIHDWLVEHNRYNLQDTSAPESHMAYSALVSGNPVCQGYAEAALVLLQAAGILVTYVSGEGTNSDGRTEGHAWNCVQIQGQWYNLDVTWDDPTSRNGTDQLRYDYFNVTDSQLARDHSWDRGSAPSCYATEMNYDRVRSLVEGDTGSYYDYSDRNVITCAMAESRFGADLRLCARPDGNTPGVEQPDQPEERPGYTENPAWDTQPEEDPYRPTFGYEPEPAPQKTGGGQGWLWALLAGIGGMLVAIFSGTRKRRRQRPQDDRPGYYDPNQDN